MRKAIAIVVTLFVCGLIINMWLNKDEAQEQSINVPLSKVDIYAPPCLQMYNCIEKYATKYKIPKNYAYGIAYKETRYLGPFHWEYNQKQGSNAGALGAMQIMPSTASMMWKDTDTKVTNQRILNDIEFNVETSMKLCRKLYDKYHDWEIVFGCYNTGQVLVNQYARDVVAFKPIEHWK